MPCSRCSRLALQQPPPAPGSGSSRELGRDRAHGRRRTARPRLLPGLDTSDSMGGPPLEAAAAELARLRDAAREHPRLAAGCRLALVTFDAEARLQVPLTPAAELPRPPRIAATGPATDYAAAFTLLRRQIAADLERLRAAGLRPARPAVFLLTDG